MDSFAINDDDISDELELEVVDNRKMMIPRNIDSFTVEKRIFETSSSVVVSAFSPKYFEGKKRVAIKCIPLHNFYQDLPDLLRRFDNPNVLPIYDVFIYPYEDARFYGIVMPYVETDLFEYFAVKNKYHLSEITVCQIMKEALSAVSYVHSEGVCHCDLKLENFLLTIENSQFRPILIDFDLSLALPNGVDTEEPGRGTKIYAAPELLYDDVFRFKKIAIFNNKIDTWSMGVMMTTLLIGYNPFHCYQNDQDTLNLIKCGIQSNDSRFIALSPYARDLICKMLCANPNQRFTIEEALNHEWFTRYLPSHINNRQ